MADLEKSVRALSPFPPVQAAALLKPGGVRVLRCQLPRKNDFYGFEPAAPSQLYPEAPAGAPAHADPWRCAEHDRPGGNASGPAPWSFPESELVIEEEADGCADPEQEAKQLEKLLAKTKLESAAKVGTQEFCHRGIVIHRLCANRQ